jgi:hypothetical protein
MSIRLAQQHPRAIAVLGNDPARVDDVRSALDPSEALLDYLVTRDRVIVFVVTRAGLTGDPAPSSGGGAHAARPFAARPVGHAGRRLEWGLGAAKALDDALIAPVRKPGFCSRR